jgi:flagellar biosynthetic protein FliQ
MMVCAPVLGITLAVGVVVSLVQVTTQIQEASLTFIPKLIAAGIALILFGPWMLRKLTQFAVQLWTGIPAMF